jgi:UPF0716 protein FxsA
MIFFLLLSLFILVPVAEIGLLISIGSSIGSAKTILIVVFTAILGAYLVRQQGLSTAFKLREKMQDGQVPAMQMAEGVALLFAGAVLLTPGFITDGIGFALLVPPIRRAIIMWFFNRASSNTRYYSTHSDSGEPHVTPSNRMGSGRNSSIKPTIIDGEYRIDD